VSAGNTRLVILCLHEMEGKKWVTSIADRRAAKILTSLRNTCTWKGKKYSRGKFAMGCVFGNFSHAKILLIRSGE
jgi:hypothetical protein